MTKVLQLSVLSTMPGPTWEPGSETLVCLDLRLLACTCPKYRRRLSKLRWRSVPVSMAKRIVLHDVRHFVLLGLRPNSSRAPKEPQAALSAEDLVCDEQMPCRATDRRHTQGYSQNCQADAHDLRCRRTQP